MKNDTKYFLNELSVETGNYILHYFFDPLNFSGNHYVYNNSPYINYTGFYSGSNLTNNLNAQTGYLYFTGNSRIDISLPNFSTEQFTFIYSYEKTNNSPSVLFSNLNTGSNGKYYGFNVCVSNYNNVLIEYYDTNNELKYLTTNYNLDTKGILSVRGYANNIFISYYNAAYDDFYTEAFEIDNNVTPNVTGSIVLGSGKFSNFPNYSGYLKDFILIDQNVTDFQLNNVIDQFVYNLNSYYTLSFDNEFYGYTNYPDNITHIFNSYSGITGCFSNQFLDQTGVISGSITGSNYSLDLTGITGYNLPNPQNLLLLTGQIEKLEIFRDTTTLNDLTVLALLKDNTITGWGNNNEGTLYGATGYAGHWTGSPVGKLTNIIDISCKGNACLALKDDNTVTGWGKNSFGKIFGTIEYDNSSGYFTGDYNNSPLSQLTDISGIQLGLNHTLFLKTDGTLLSWGDNSYNQVAFINDRDNLSYPLKISITGIYQDYIYLSGLILDYTGQFNSKPAYKYINDLENFGLSLYNNNTGWILDYSGLSDIINLTGNVTPPPLSNDLNIPYQIVVENSLDTGINLLYTYDSISGYINNINSWRIFYSGPFSEIKITGNDSVTNDRFGNSISINSAGNVALIGAYTDTINSLSNVGSAYIFTGNGSNWAQAAKITGNDSTVGDFFASSVAINSGGNIILIGAQGDNMGAKVDVGSAYIFTGSENNWVEVTKITGSDGEANDAFGNSVALNSVGNVAIIGAYLDDINALSNVGSVYIFTGSEGNWSQAAKITGNDSTANDNFGYSLALNSSGNIVVIGAYADNSNAGSAYIFTGSGNNWIQTAKITGSDSIANDRFGGDVSINSFGNIVSVGAYGNNSSAGSVYIFTGSGANWVQVAKITGNDSTASDRFGINLSFNDIGNTLFVGAHSDNSSAGSAYVFTGSGSNWAQFTKINASDSAANDFFGNRIAVNSAGDVSLIGAFGDNSNAGSVYIYVNNNKWTVSSGITGYQNGDGSSSLLPLNNWSGIEDNGYYGQINIKPKHVQLDYIYNSDTDGRFTGVFEDTLISELTGISKISVGDYHNIVLRINNTITGWGGEGAGANPRDGNGLTGVLDIAAGNLHTIAILNTNNSITGWGEDGAGQATDPLGLTGAIQIDAGFNSTSILFENEDLTYYGNVGYGDSLNDVKKYNTSEYGTYAEYITGQEIKNLVSGNAHFIYNIEVERPTIITETTTVIISQISGFENQVLFSGVTGYNTGWYKDIPQFYGTGFPMYLVSGIIGTITGNVLTGIDITTSSSTSQVLVLSNETYQTGFSSGIYDASKTGNYIYEFTYVNDGSQVNMLDIIYLDTGYHTLQSKNIFNKEDGYIANKTTNLNYLKNYTLQKNLDYLNSLGVDLVLINQLIDNDDILEIYLFKMDSGLNINLNNSLLLSKASKNFRFANTGANYSVNLNGVGQISGLDYLLTGTLGSPIALYDLFDNIEGDFVKTGEAIFTYTGETGRALNNKDFLYLNGQKLISGYHYNFSNPNIEYITGNIPVTGIIHAFNVLIEYDRYTGSMYSFDLPRFSKNSELIWLNGIKLRSDSYYEISENDQFYNPTFYDKTDVIIYNNTDNYFNE
jgi:alpha-tubulin suppressor-like RCC1 family protein